MCACPVNKSRAGRLCQCAVSRRLRTASQLFKKNNNLIEILLKYQNLPVLYVSIYGLIFSITFYIFCMFVKDCTFICMSFFRIPARAQPARGLRDKPQSLIGFAGRGRGKTLNPAHP
jgi:hypothetical protein